MQLQPTHHVRTPDGARLAVAVAGAVEDRSLPLAVLQHGFPDTPATWRHLAPALVEAGWRVAMPWLRGYHPSTRGDRRPSAEVYADDLAAVHGALGGDPRAVLVGHDWGAVAAWRAGCDGTRWSRVVGLAVPPDPALHGFLLAPDQLLRSRYQLLAQLPVQGWVHAQRLRPLLDLWLRWSPGREPEVTDVVALRDALRTPAHVAAALAPYRSHLVDGVLGRMPAADGPVPSCPSLLLHGADDGCIHVRHAEAARPVLAATSPDARVRVVPAAGHWLHLERPTVVTAAIVAFLADGGDRDPAGGVGGAGASASAPTRGT